METLGAIRLINTSQWRPLQVAHRARVLSAIRHYKRKPKITQGNLRVINTEKIVVRISYNTYETLL